MARCSKREYHRIIKLIREKRQYALDKSTKQAVLASRMEQKLQAEQRKPMPNPDRLRGYNDTLDSARAVGKLWRGIYAGKIREEEAMEAVRKFVLRAVAEAKKRDLGP